MSAVHSHSLNCLLWQSRPESRQSESWFILRALFKIKLLSEETWRRRAWNRRSKARKFFRAVHPFFVFLFFSCMVSSRGERRGLGTEKRCSHNLQSGHATWWSADNCSILPTVCFVACENTRFSSLFAAVERFAQRNVFDSATEIPYWWHKSMFT